MSSKAKNIWIFIGLAILVFSVFFTVFGFIYNLTELPLATEYVIQPFWDNSGMRFEVLYCLIWVLSALVSFVILPITILLFFYKIIKK